MNDGRQPPLREPCTAALCAGAIAMAVLALVCGCGPGGGRVPVRGTVKLQGAPLGGAVVRFHAEPGVAGNGGIGVTDEAGRFALRTPQADDGILPGDYRITVSCRALKPEAERRVAEMKAAGVPPAITEADTVEIVPAGYTVPDRTPLRQSVGPHGNEVEVDLAADGDRK
jgi:hypothetical protein